jgi:serine protease Do
MNAMCNDQANNKTKALSFKLLIVSFATALLLLFARAPVSAKVATESLQSRLYHARDAVLPALVHIQPVVSDYRTGKKRKQSIVGSGVIIHADGYVVTNYHVAGKAQHILCTLHDKEQVEAVLIGGDPSTDLAVIKLDLSDYKGVLSVADFGDSDSLQVGQQVIAMGSPLALARSITFGVISTIDRFFTEDARLPSGERTGQYNLWLQTDAAINPGNSGGPLVNLDGLVVGVNSRASTFANNIGFSIPSNIVRAVADELIANGKVSRSWIGVHFQPLQNLENWFGSKDESGVLIASVDAKAPAQLAHLSAGDIIKSINGVQVSARFNEELPDVYRRIAESPIGSELELIVQRNGETFTALVRTRELGVLQGEDLECPEWGFTVKEITRQMALDYQLTSDSGVYVTGVKRSGPANEGGLRGGDVITRIDGIDVADLAAFTLLYQERVDSKQELTMLTLRRGGAVRFAVVKPEKESPAEEGVDTTGAEAQ